jgi:SAM-dependent methyltransferase
MPEIIQTCILCGSNRSTLFDHRSFHGRQVTNRLCLDCGFVYQSPRMTGAEAATFYADEYRLLQEGSADPTARNINIQKARAASLLGFVQPFIPAIFRHLDIGCSMGILLLNFQGVFQNQSVGVEPGEAHRASACKQGLTVYATLEDLENTKEARFNLVTIVHVLEHLPDPLGYLNHLRESILQTDGRLLIEVPNLYAHDSFEVAHLVAFSPHTLREVLRKSGFEILKIEKHGRPNSETLPLFLTVLCKPTGQPDPSPVRPEHWVALKRRSGMLWRRILARIFPKRTWLERG